MSIETYGGFDVEASADEQLWRFVDLVSFAALVHSGQLFFPMLAALEDPWEGSPGMEDLVEHASETGLDGDELVAAIVRYQKTFQRQRSRIVASCWYCADQESAAMWELYGAQGRGIAIQSTVGRLVSAIEDERGLVVGRVQYVDHLSAKLEESRLGSAFSKNAAYSHEREVRVVTELDESEVDLLKKGKRGAPAHSVGQVA